MHFRLAHRCTGSKHATRLESCGPTEIFCASLGILDYPRCGSTLAGPSGITASAWVSSPFGYGLYGCWAGEQRRERAEQISDEIPGLQRANPDSGLVNSYVRSTL